MQRKYFLVSGYWKDTKEEFTDLVFTNYHDEPCQEDLDKLLDYIEEYGWEESDLKIAIRDGEETVHDMVIISYENLELW